MNYNKGKLKAQLSRHEGLILTSYQDSEGVYTIGYGRNLQTMTITQSQADEWLKDDIDTAADELNEAFPWVGNLSEVRRRVLINMTFNLGINGIKKFKKMWKALERRDYNEAAAQMMDSKWSDQVGDRSIELIAMMVKG